MMSDIATKIATVFAAAVLALGVAGGAVAATVTPLGGSTNAVGNTADVFGAGYGANTPTGATWSQDPTLTPPPAILQGAYKSPFFGTASGAGQTHDFFSVGKQVAQGGVDQPSATLTFSSAQSAISVLWGTIDLYNTIKFFSGGTEVFSYSGLDVGTLLGLSLLPGTQTYDYVSLLNFADFGPDGFDSIEFISTGVAFEFALAPVPVPAAGLLLLTALGGVAVLRRRKTA